MGYQVDAQNRKILVETLAKLSPDLWKIGKTMDEVNLNPSDLRLLPDVIEGIWKIKMGSGWGSITLQLQDKVVTGVNIVETRVSKEYTVR